MEIDPHWQVRGAVPGVPFIMKVHLKDYADKVWEEEMKKGNLMAH